eukprot:gene11590-biopygen7524
MQPRIRLQWVHGKGYIHCDVKPANCCVGRGTAAGTLYLFDFGIAKRAAKSTAQRKEPQKVSASGPQEPRDSARLRGSPRYMRIIFV